MKPFASGLSVAVALLLFPPLARADAVPPGIDQVVAALAEVVKDRAKLVASRTLRAKLVNALCRDDKADVIAICLPNAPADTPRDEQCRPAPAGQVLLMLQLGGDKTCRLAGNCGANVVFANTCHQARDLELDLTDPHLLKTVGDDSVQFAERLAAGGLDKKRVELLALPALGALIYGAIEASKDPQNFEMQVGDLALKAAEQIRPLSAERAIFRETALKTTLRNQIHELTSLLTSDPLKLPVPTGQAALDCRNKLKLPPTATDADALSALGCVLQDFNFIAASPPPTTTAGIADEANSCTNFFAHSDDRDTLFTALSQPRAKTTDYVGPLAPQTGQDGTTQVNPLVQGCSSLPSGKVALCRKATLALRFAPFLHKVICWRESDDPRRDLRQFEHLYQEEIQSGGMIYQDALGGPGAHLKFSDTVRALLIGPDENQLLLSSVAQNPELRADIVKLTQALKLPAPAANCQAHLEDGGEPAERLACVLQDMKFVSATPPPARQDSDEANSCQTFIRNASGQRLFAVLKKNGQILGPQPAADGSTIEPLKQGCSQLPVGSQNLCRQAFLILGLDVFLHKVICWKATLDPVTNLRNLEAIRAQEEKSPPPGIYQDALTTLAPGISFTFHDLMGLFPRPPAAPDSNSLAALRVDATIAEAKPTPENSTAKTDAERLHDKLLAGFGEIPTIELAGSLRLFGRILQARAAAGDELKNWAAALETCVRTQSSDAWISCKALSWNERSNRGRAVQAVRDGIMDLIYAPRLWLVENLSKAQPGEPGRKAGLGPEVDTALVTIIAQTLAIATDPARTPDAAIGHFTATLRALSALVAALNKLQTADDAQTTAAPTPAAPNQCAAAPATASNSDQARDEQIAALLLTLADLVDLARNKDWVGVALMSETMLERELCNVPSEIVATMRFSRVLLSMYQAASVEDAKAIFSAALEDVSSREKRFDTGTFDVAALVGARFGWQHGLLPVPGTDNTVWSRPQKFGGVYAPVGLQFGWKGLGILLYPLDIGSYLTADGSTPTASDAVRAGGAVYWRPAATVPVDVGGALDYGPSLQSNPAQVRFFGFVALELPLFTLK